MHFILDLRGQSLWKSQPVPFLSALDMSREDVIPEAVAAILQP